MSAIHDNDVIGSILYNRQCPQIDYLL
jgi:hypothetical protein